MKQLIILLAIIGLALTVIPSVLVFMGLLSVDLNKILMLMGMLMWFLCAPLWFKKTQEQKD